MTEYTISSQAYREYMSARDRTVNWVQSHSPTKADFYSPSVAPSLSDDDEVILPSSPPSDDGSSHSLPPQMVLRFPDGRPDVPIPQGHASPSDSSRGDWGASNRYNRSQTFPRSAQPHARSPSHGMTGPVSHSIHDGPSSSIPEEIRVLPSRGQNGPLPSTSHQSRSKSLPRNAYSSSVATVKPSNRLHGPPLSLPPPMHTPPLQPHQVPILQGPGVTFDRPAPPWHPYAGKGPHASRRPPKPHHQPPAIVYAPGHHSRTPRYAPPAIYAYPPLKGPNGVKYSHSAPVAPSHYPHAGATPYPSAVSSTHLSSVHEERSNRGRSRGRERSQSRTLYSEHGHRSRASSTASFESNGSGSTYYVLPNARQKVHIIAPEPSIYTATSTTKSPTSPRKPFFQRLFSFKDRFSAADSTKGSSKGSGRRLIRRHSTGGSSHGHGPARISEEL